MVTVTRNPVPAQYVREHGAPGAIAQAIQLGRILMKERTTGGRAVAGRLAAELGGDVIAAGEIAALELETRGGYDVGRLTVGDIELSFLNEYMTAEKCGQRVATFPDLITTLDYEDGTPRASAQLQPSARILVLWAPREDLILGAGMRDPANFKPVEEILRRALGGYGALGNVTESEMKTVWGGVARGCYIAEGSAQHPTSSASWYGVNRRNKTD
jgi:DUF917 family protein